MPAFSLAFVALTTMPFTNLGGFDLNDYAKVRVFTYVLIRCALGQRMHHNPRIRFLCQ